MSSSLRPNGKTWSIPEQIIEDHGITLQFELTPDGQPRLHLFGDALPFGNRTLFFMHPDGRCDGGGSHTAHLCKPAWATNPEEL